jgi:hypothetical protein
MFFTLALKMKRNQRQTSPNASASGSLLAL